MITPSHPIEHIYIIPTQCTIPFHVPLIPTQCTIIPLHVPLIPTQYTIPLHAPLFPLDLGPVNN